MDDDDFLDDILGDDGMEESIGEMLEAVNSSGGMDDSLDGLLASPPASPTKETKIVDPNSLSLTEAAAIAASYAEHDDMLDDLLATPTSSKGSVLNDGNAPKPSDFGDSKGSFIPKEIADMEDALENALEPTESQGEDDSDDDSLSGVLHGNLDDLDLGDFEAQTEEIPAKEEPPMEPIEVPMVEEKKEKEEEVKPAEEKPATPTSESPAAVEQKHEPPMSPLTHGDDSEFDDFDAFLDDALVAPTPTPAPAPAPSKPKSKRKPAPAAAKPKPARKPAVPKLAKKSTPKIKPTTKYEHDQPVGDIKKPKKKPLSFLKKKTTTPKTTTSSNGEKKKSGSKKGFMSTISRWSNRSKDKKSTSSVTSANSKSRKTSNRSVATSVATTRSAATYRSTASGKNAMTSGGAVCGIVAKEARCGDIVQCGVQFNPFVHGFRAPCDLCVYFLSDQETLKFLETGRSPRVMYTRGGCSTDCQVFPRPSGGPPIRLCRQCYHNSHREVFQKFVQEQNVLQTLST